MQTKASAVCTSLFCAVVPSLSTSMANQKRISHGSRLWASSVHFLPQKLQQINMKLLKTIHLSLPSPLAAYFYSLLAVHTEVKTQLLIHSGYVFWCTPSHVDTLHDWTSNSDVKYFDCKLFCISFMEVMHEPVAASNTISMSCSVILGCVYMTMVYVVLILTRLQSN